jgi:hypothetical protein
MQPLLCCPLPPHCMLHPCIFSSHPSCLLKSSFLLLFHFFSACEGGGEHEEQGWFISKAHIGDVFSIESCSRSTVKTVKHNAIPFHECGRESILKWRAEGRDRFPCSAQ